MATAASRTSTGGAGSTSSTDPSQFWLLKLPNFVHERLAQQEAARAAALPAAAAAATSAAGGPGTPPGVGAGSSSPAAAAAALAAASQPVAELWIRRLRPDEPRQAQRQMKLVVPDVPTTSSAASSASQLIPPPPLEFPLVPKSQPSASMPMVFGQDATTLVPAVPPGLDGRGALAAQESYKFANFVSYAVDAVMPTSASSSASSASRRAGGLLSVDPRLEAAQRQRLAEQQAKQHTVMALRDTHPGAMAIGGAAGNIGPAAAATAASGRSAPSLQPQAIKRKPAQFKLLPERPEKRVRMESDALEAAVLAHMSQARYSALTLSALGKALDQPQAAIQAVARKLLVRMEEGTNKTLYTLRPEYKLAGDDAAVAALRAPVAEATAAAAVAQAQQQAELTGTASAIASGRPSVGANNTRTLPMDTVKREL